LKRLHNFLAHPLTRGMDIDAPATTETRRQILQQKPFLRKIYIRWYQMLLDSLPATPGRVLELGSGAGFLKDFIPDLITSEVFFCRHIDVVLDGMNLPYTDGSLSAIVMSDVFHHLPRPQDFLFEAQRCIRPQGVISMIEPWYTPWSEWVFDHLHHEMFDPAAQGWGFVQSGPLSGSNQALPWIMFERDIQRFTDEFPGWKVEKIAPFLPFTYLLSGGISLRSLMPGWSFGFWTMIERLKIFPPSRWAMFAHILLRRV
jgi:SAM-dependent methyltransferase